MNKVCYPLRIIHLHMNRLESHPPAPRFDERKTPLVSHADRTALQTQLIRESDMDGMVWIDTYADKVSDAFVADGELRAWAHSDHPKALARLRETLYR